MQAQTTKTIIALALCAFTLTALAALGGYYSGRTKGQEQASDQAYKLSTKADPLWQLDGRPAPTGDSQTLKLGIARGDVRAALTLSDRDTILAAKALKTGNHHAEANFLLAALQAQAEAYSILYQGVWHLAFQHPKPWSIF